MRRAAPAPRPTDAERLAAWEREGVAGLLSVVMPARDEEGHLEDTVRGQVAALEAAGIAHEIVVVDDGSTDSTPAILERLGEEMPTVRSIRSGPPHGYGLAVRRGLQAFRGDAVAVSMADGSDDPEDLVRYYRTFREGWDCVFGTRFSQGGSTERYPWPKMVLNRLGNLGIRLLFWNRYDDFTNAFKLYGRHVIAGIQPLLSLHFNLTVELPLKTLVRGYRFTVISTSWRNRDEGVSKFKIREMGSRYLFIIFYCWLEWRLSRGDYRREPRTGDLPGAATGDERSPG